MKRSLDGFLSSTHPTHIYSKTQQVKVSFGYDEGLGFGDGRVLPIEIGRIIFTYAKANLDSMALVNKNWVALADEDICREKLRASTPEISGVTDWKECVKVVKIVDELPIPRQIYRDVEEGWIFTFIPREVTVINKNKEEEVVPLNSLEVIGKLFKKPITDLETPFNPDSWIAAIKEPTKLEAPHWAGIKPKVIGKSMTYQQQLKLAEEIDNKVHADHTGAKEAIAAHSAEKAKDNKRKQVIKVSDLIDTAASVFIAYAKSGNKIRHFVWDLDNEEYDLVRVNGKMDECQIGLGFAPSGLSVFHTCFASQRGHVGFVCARKSFGL
jgi:hypothetical protein